MEDLIVAVIVAAAALYVGRRALGVVQQARQEKTGAGCGSGCGGCGDEAPAADKLVQLRVTRRER